jgi:hypothetical protein
MSGALTAGFPHYQKAMTTTAMVLMCPFCLGFMCVIGTKRTFGSDAHFAR